MQNNNRSAALLGKGTGRRQRLNCWEFYTCPGVRQQACPAFTRNAGRSCWLVAGTLCGGRVQGSIATKISECRICDFYLGILSLQS